MKKSTLFKSIAAAALIVVGVSSKAQVTVSNPQVTGLPTYNYTDFTTYATGAETATYGAQMPFYVVRDANVNGTTLFNKSSFVWTFTGITALTEYNNASNTITSAGTDVLYNHVTATMPSSGTVTLKVQEKSNPKVGTGCIDATGKTITINLVDKPSIVGTTSADLGGCGLSTSYTITPSTLTGTAPFYVEYTITGVDIDGNAIGSATGNTYVAKLATATTDITIADNQLAYLGSASTLANTVKGKYTVTINKVWDSVSAKAINRDDLAATPTGTKTVAIYVYPTPATGDIQHITTLP